MAIIKTKFDRGVEGATNIVDTGTEGTKVAVGTTAQRGSTTGQWRFNTTTGFFEGINNAGDFSTLEPTPTVTNVDVTEVASDAGGNETFVITGTNFSSGGVIAFIGSSAQFNASTTTFNNATQVTAVAPKASFLNAQEPYKIKFTASSGVAGTSATGLINVDNAPAWTTSAGTLATILDNATGTHATLAATDAEGDTITYSETGGTNITGAGLSLNSSTGAISGDPTDVTSSTTVSFTGRATAGSKTTDRSFNIIINPFLDGSSSNKAASSATSIYNLGSSFQGSSANGLYWLDPDGTGTYKAQYYCRMDYGGGWVQVMNFVRENTGNNTYPLANVAARGTMPTNPYVTPNGQTKVHNTVISNLETVVDSNKYDILLHYFTYTGSYPDSGTSMYPSSGTTVATVSSGVHSDASGFASDIVQLRNTRKLSDAITDGTSGGLHNGTLNAHTRHVSGIPSSIQSWTGINETDANVNSQMASSNSAIINYEYNADSAATSYSNLCDDDMTGLYIIRRQFNCYHNYGILYVR
tara:strand:- start:146 stop:1726 length:1581 start_codon:yes stop_codon:yes gene_type:complete